MILSRPLLNRVRTCFLYRINYKIPLLALFVIVLLVLILSYDGSNIPKENLGRKASSHDPYENTKPVIVPVTKRSRSYSVNPSPTCFSLDCDKENNFHAKQDCLVDEASKWNLLGVQAMERYVEGDRITENDEDYMNLYLENAVEYFMTSLKHDPNCARAQVNLGLVYLEQGKVRSALEQITIGIELNLKEARYYAMRSFINEILENKEDQIKDRQTAESLDKYIGERKYFGILLCNTTETHRYSRWPMIIQYTPKAEQVLARKVLIFIEFSKISISNYALIPPGTTDYFVDNKYLVLRKIIPPFVLRPVQDCYHTGIVSHSVGFKDDQAIRFVAQNDRCGRLLLFNMVDLVRRAIAHNTKPAYAYFGGYVNGSKLNPHSDRPQCEFTFSITVQQNPADQPWGLGMYRIPQFEKNDQWPGRDKEPWPEDKDQIWVDLYAGDGLLFMGRHMIHFRKGLLLGEKRWLNQVFLHYVQQDFTGSLD